MQQALFVLQMPLEELAEWLEEVIETNPLLEKGKTACSIRCSDMQNLFEQERAALFSMREHLLSQLSIGFDTKEEKAVAEILIEELDENGFCAITKEELPVFLQPFLESVRAKVQQLDPLGVGSFDRQQYLLFQLKERGKQEGFAYQLIANHFSLLKQKEYGSIAKALHLEKAQVKQIIQNEIIPLSLAPIQEPLLWAPPSPLPDLIFSTREGIWEIEVNEQILPSFSIHSRYRLEKGREVKQYLAEKRREIRWIVIACQKRRETLLKIGKALLTLQRSFFSGEGRGFLSPLSCREIAQKIGMHESTVARAIRGKWVSCHAGLLPLSLFFNQGKNVSSASVKEVIDTILTKENRKKPLSDLALLEELKKRGIICARRTVAKYRSSLSIPSSFYRK